MKQEGSMVKNRKYSSYFCDQEVFQMSRHLERAHSETHEVAQALSYIGKVRKNLALKRISKSRIFKHNVEALNNKEGLLYVARSSSKQHVVEHYIPCTYCYGF